MQAYTVTVTALFLFAILLTAMGLYPLAMALFPPAVAYWQARGRTGRSTGLVICAGLAALTAAGGGVVMYMAAALTGFAPGMAISRRWSFGRCVAAGVAVLFLLSMGHLLLHWTAYRHDWTVFSNYMVQQVAEEAGAAQAGQAEALSTVLRWYDRNWEYVQPGMLFGIILLYMTLLMTVVSKQLREKAPGTEPPGGFLVMRPPDWLVWAAIALCVMWYADRQWPETLLRMISWNGALALIFIYMLNGLSILLYGLRALEAGFFAVLLTVLVLFWLGAQPVLCMAGFFDTWWDLRGRFDRWAALRRARKRPDDDNV
jgi:hypothetical protein